MPVLVYVEHTGGKFKKSAYEAVCFGNSLGNKINEKTFVLSIGEVDPVQLETFQKYGPVKVISVEGDKLKTFVNQAYASIISKVADENNVSLIIMSNSFSTKGMAPRLAVKRQASFGEAVIELPEIKGDEMIVKKSAFSGKAFVYEKLTSKNKVITLAPNSFPIQEITPDSNQGFILEKYAPTLSDSDFGTLVKEIIRNTDKISLPDADRVVSAGRGLKGPENWKMIEDLAEVLGAATACSKPVSDAGWRPHSEHVGQTGIAVSPNLYIAIGISGAIQHLAGVSSSKVIVVINKDPEAPFFKVADYGIVGDAFEIVPKLIEAAKGLRG